MLNCGSNILFLVNGMCKKREIPNDVNVVEPHLRIIHLCGLIGFWFKTNSYTRLQNPKTVVLISIDENIQLETLSTIFQKGL
jgi:hypothetical protein